MTIKEKIVLELRASGKDFTADLVEQSSLVAEPKDGEASVVWIIGTEMVQNTLLSARQDILEATEAVWRSPVEVMLVVPLERSVEWMTSRIFKCRPKALL